MSDKRARATKTEAHPKRTIKEAEDDHELGLWIDKDFLKRHQGRSPVLLISEPNPTGKRYLELADLLLQPKPKKKLRQVG